MRSTLSSIMLHFLHGGLEAAMFHLAKVTSNCIMAQLAPKLLSKQLLITKKVRW